MEKKTFLGGLITGILLTAITVRSSPFMAMPISATPASAPHTEQNTLPAAASTPTGIAQITDILPDSTKLGVSFSDAVVKMVQGGAIDKDKFIRLYAGRKALTKEQLLLLDTPSSQPIVVNQENAGLLLNLFWPLGIANSSSVLSKGPIGTKYMDKAAGFASTGGWTLGKQDGGKLLNSLSIVHLTPEQEAMAMDMAQHMYRPCCDNPTAFPDCNHGAAMLGFIELALSQGLPPDRTYQQALLLNSYWFPQNYVELATYFRTNKNLDWHNADPREVLGATYSSSRGFGAIHARLQAEGLAPKPQDAGGCAT